MEKKRFSGLFCATLTPFQHGDANTLNVDLIDKYAASLKSDGVEGVWVNGTSGESMSLSAEERMLLVEHWVPAARKHSLQMIVHIGAQSLADCKKMAAHAEAHGAEAIACMAPVFFKPASVDALVEFLAQVAAAAPKTAFFYYYYPKITGVSFRWCDLAAHAKHRIPTLAGAKFTGDDLGDVLLSLADNEHLDVLLGNELMIFPSLTIGVHGSVALAYSVFAPMFVKIVEAYKAGDFNKAREEQIKCAKMFDVLMKQPHLISATKALLRLKKGLDFGPVRSPLPVLSEEQEKTLLAAMAQFD